MSKRQALLNRGHHRPERPVHEGGAGGEGGVLCERGARTEGGARREVGAKQSALPSVSQGAAVGALAGDLGAEKGV